MLSLLAFQEEMRQEHFNLYGVFVIIYILIFISLYIFLLSILLMVISGPKRRLGVGVIRII